MNNKSVETLCSETPFLSVLETFPPPSHETMLIFLFHETAQTTEPVPTQH